MTRLVYLTPSTTAPPDGYDVQLGPLRFVTTADSVSETVGDGLDAVGAALVATDRKPRPLKLKLPVRGPDRGSADPRADGIALRRAVRALLDNARWRLTGFYFVWEPDPDLDGWLLIGSADLAETDPGISFGEYEMDLSDVYIVGRPGTHRPGRRAVVGDRRGGLVPRDTRRLLYSTDFNTQPLPVEPLAIPGDVVDLVRSGNQPVGSISPGRTRSRDGRSLWRTVAATDGEVVTYLPDEAYLNDRWRYLSLDDLGSVRIWTLDGASSYPPDPAAYTAGGDEDPTAYGWTQLYGDVLTADGPLAIDNGACRVIWLGPGPGGGLAIEYWDATVGHFVRNARVLHALHVREQRVVEITPERAVIEWRAGQYALRAILQRGWWGPRLESYDDGGDTASLEIALAATDDTIVAVPQHPPGVDAFLPEGIGDPAPYDSFGERFADRIKRREFSDG